MAAAAGVNVPSGILDWALSIGSKDCLDNAQLDDIRRWKSGETHPSVQDISEISRRTHVPFGYFFLQNPIDDTPTVFAHRTIGSEEPNAKPSRDLVDTIGMMSDLQDWARQDQIDSGESPLPFVNSKKLDSGTAAIASSIRNTLGINKNWYEASDANNPQKAFDFLRTCAEHARIIVMMCGTVGDNTHRVLDPKEFRAFALIDEYAPLVFINRRDEPVTARLFSLVHEFAHIWLGEAELFNDASIPHAVSDLERMCNAVATDILMPDAAFRLAWSRLDPSMDLDGRIAAIRGIFPVSSTSVVLRALNDGFIDHKQYKQSTHTAQEWMEHHKNDTTHGGNYYITKLSRFDRRILDHIVASVAEGRTSYTDAYRLTGTNRRTFSELMKKVDL